jgi:hypothetical protein
MSSVQTLPVLHTQYLETRFEPCGAFADAGDADPICADCGWLHDEHAERSDRRPVAPRGDDTNSVWDEAAPPRGA